MRIRHSLVLLLLTHPLLAQSAPRRTECLQWDEAYAQMVALGVVGASILALVLGLTVGLLFGRQVWWAASPRGRIWIAGAMAFLFASFTIVVWPRVLPLGKLLYASIDPRYPDCQTMAFGAPGLLGGLLGQGVAAYAQWQAIELLLLGSCALGALVAWVASEALVRNRGLEAMARGGEA
jgi:hypothetical protein